MKNYQTECSKLAQIKQQKSLSINLIFLVLHYVYIAGSCKQVTGYSEIAPNKEMVYFPLINLLSGRLYRGNTRYKIPLGKLH